VNDSPVSGASSSGLGRGLGGILGQAMTDSRAPEVSMLLGASALRKAPEVRQMVSELALQALSESFDTLGVLLVRCDVDQPLAAVTSRIPEEWSIDEPVGFEISGRLWGALNKAEDGHEQFGIAGSHLLVTRQSMGTSVVGAAVLRTEEFDSSEVGIVERLLRSVATALGSGSPIPEGASLRVLVQPSGEGVLADVRLGNDGDRRHAASVASDSERAVAQAAAELCDLPLSVRFAGKTVIDNSIVNLVVVDEPAGGPLFGLAITDQSSASGPAEATFAAASVVDAGPYGFAQTGATPGGTSA